MATLAESFLADLEELSEDEDLGLRDGGEQRGAEAPSEEVREPCRSMESKDHGNRDSRTRKGKLKKRVGIERDTTATEWEERRLVVGFLKELCSRKRRVKQEGEGFALLKLMHCCLCLPPIFCRSTMIDVP